MKITWFRTFTAISHFSYYCHIFITFWGSGTRSGPQKSYLFIHIPGHFCCSHYFHILARTSFSSLSIRTIFTTNAYACGASLTAEKTHPEFPEHVLSVFCLYSKAAASAAELQNSRNILYFCFWGKSGFF